MDNVFTILDNKLYACVGGKWHPAVYTDAGVLVETEPAKIKPLRVCSLREVCARMPKQQSEEIKTGDSPPKG